MIELAQALGEHWLLIGGQMVFLHEVERQARDLRPTDDVDVVVNLRIDPQGLTRIHATLTAHRFGQRQHDMVLSTEPLPSVVLLDASAISDVDVTAIEAFEELHDTLATRGVETWFANLHSRTRALAEHRERWETRRGRLFPTIDAAVEAFQQR